MQRPKDLPLMTIEEVETDKIINPGEMTPVSFSTLSKWGLL
jgi:hypothetical protein